MDSKNELKEKLKQLNQRFFDKLPSRLFELNKTWVGYQAGDSECLSKALGETHNLAGSGTTFGCSEISDIAVSLEGYLHQLRDGSKDKKIIDKANIIMAQLVTFRSGGPAGANATDIEVVSDLLEAKASLPIYLVNDDELLAEKMALEIAVYDYHVNIFTAISDVVDACKQQKPSVIVTGMVFPEGDDAGANAIKKIKTLYTEDIPAFFMSKRDDIQSRLAAVRAGGEAYFVKPVNIKELVERFDVVLAKAKSEPYRVLIVDDDDVLVQHYAGILESVGLEVEIVNDPLEVMPSLVGLRPDILVVDLHMPNCTGIELSMVLRQHRAYQDIPILFLSNEADIKKQYEARHQGVDDFLMKPIEDMHLISTVVNRAQRARVMSSKITTESLTGLLTRERFINELDRYMFLYRRNKRTFCFAMLDIDFFKKVNDQYGHLCGDAVLKNFSKVLRERLRATDIIGRYGGEEFCIVFPDTELDEAVKLLNELRERFATTTHFLNGHPIVTTFSGGVVAYSDDYEDRVAVIEAADSALYEAKNKGRNRVVVAE